MPPLNTVFKFDPSTKARSHELRAKIKAEITAHPQQLMPFSRYMQMALYEPELGYYRNSAYLFGKQGDYYTAPEFSPLFAYCIATQVGQVLKDFTEGAVMEIGAGSGILAARVMQALAQQNQLPVHYYIIEPSNQQQAVQRATIAEICPELLSHFVWLQDWPDFAIKGVILANEVMDALPVECFIVQQGQWLQRVVALTEDQFHWQAVPPLLSTLHTQLEEVRASLTIPLQDGYFSEISLALDGFMARMQACLQAGLCLLFDYGYPRREYYHPDRAQGTLLCYAQQKVQTDPFLWPGVFDISAHVDFTHAAHIANQYDLAVAGYGRQAAFLLNCDLLGQVERLMAAPNHQHLDIKKQVQLLTCASEMGEMVKTLALTRDYQGPLKGFQSYNDVARL